MGIIKTIISFFVDIIETIVVALCIFVIVYLFLVQPHQVIGNSMLPNFYDKEYILTDKISYHTREPKRGEVIVFKSPEDKDKDFIKRIIGLPGERIKIQNGKIFINDLLLMENYIDKDLQTPAGKFFLENQEFIIPPNAFIVLGDNRLNSSDSRSWGVIEKKEIIGRAILVYWPPNRMGLISEVSYR